MNNPIIGQNYQYKKLNFKYSSNGISPSWIFENKNKKDFLVNIAILGSDSGEIIVTYDLIKENICLYNKFSGLHTYWVCVPVLSNS